MRLRLPAALATLVAALALAPAAAAAPPRPFGHSCAPVEGALYCPTASDAGRVASFDGVPLDVDVYLPLTGDGPFPTIATLHGFGGSKADAEAGGTASTSNAPFYARHGYAVVVPTARGFGRSCGVPDSRTAPCARGWTHLADVRFEVRDVQYLLGRLVDQGIARPDALGATGVSYGGGPTLMLARLRDRIVTPDGTLQPWTAPSGRSLALQAAWARWPWSDLADALVPNGRLGPETFATPVGVPLQSWLGLLTSPGVLGAFAPPAGADPAADIAALAARLDLGEPYGADVSAALDLLHRFHGALGIPPAASAAPLLIQAGWTDELFPVGQSLRLYDLLRGRNRRAPVALQVGDLGHARAANHPTDGALLAADALRFFDAQLRRVGRPPRPGSVVAFLQRCPRARPRGGGPARTVRFSRLAPGRVRFGAPGRQRVTSSGGDATLSSRLDPLGLDPCRAVRAEVARGTAVATTASPGFTLLGRASIRARVRVRGGDAQLVGRLWDVGPGGRRQRLIDRAVVRVPPGRRLRFRLNGNGWRFARGHTVKLELVGRDAPAYRPSNGAFAVEVSRLTVALPTRERNPLQPLPR